MYLTMFGGSTLLHVLAAHPRVVATLGIVATVTMLVSNSAVADRARASRYAHALDQTVSSHGRVDPRLLAEAADAAARLETGGGREMDAAIRYALLACGAGCVELTPEIVEHDPGLRQAALYVAELDRIATGQAARLAASR